MAKLQIIYEVSDEIEELIKTLEDHINLNKDEAIIYNLLQKKFQLAFNEGRKVQKQISLQSGFSDSLLHKAEI